MTLVEPESAKELPEADPLSVANNIALRQLSHSPKTAHQLTAALLKRGVTPGTAEQVICRMTELGYIDDLAYARMFIRSKTLYRHLSKRALAYELTKCGVAKELIDQALAELPDDQ
ncbi:MAG: recombination regulator RecX, partial [Actinomycetales bacterium]|nr:recombination regulator RecX [Actinomycetales bacterium]